MVYAELAEDLVRYLAVLHKHRSQKEINRSMQGGYFILEYIAQRGDFVTPGDISNAMGVSTARIAVALNSLESEGLITRQIDSSDRRRIAIQITPAGKATAEERRRATRDTIEKVLCRLGEADAKEYVRITKRLTEMQPDRPE